MSGACEFKPAEFKKKDEKLKAEAREDNKRVDVARLAGLGIVAIFFAWLHLLQPVWLSNIVALVAVSIGGYQIFAESITALKKGRVNMELSMVIAIIASLVLSQFFAGIVITFFAVLSEFVEGFIISRGRGNIQLLYDKAPRKALVKTENSDVVQEVEIDKVTIGNIVVVREGDIIPVDGEIINGSSIVDQSSITGESTPVEKVKGDLVFAGTVNQSQQLEVRCEKLSKDTTFAKIIHLIEEAEASKAPVQKLSDKLAARLIQFAIGLSVITYIATQNVISALSVIVVAGACGVAVGTPIALLATNGKLSRQGIIVKGGLQLERLKNAGTLIVDKTGTLTYGKPAVSQVVSFAPASFTPRQVLEYAAIAESNVNHPLAKAIVLKAHLEGIKVSSQAGSLSDLSLDNASEVSIGRGVVKMTPNGKKIVVGNANFIKENFGHTTSSSLLLNYLNDKNRDGEKRNNYQLLVHKEKEDNKENNDSNIATPLTAINLDNSGNFENTLQDFSSTLSLVSVDNQVIGAILFEDQIRPEAKEAISKIRGMGIEVIMLTGDSEKIARRISEQLGIDKYYASLLPQDKVSKIEEILQQQDGTKKRKTVIMVGDGINDAPALAKADVGIAMGKTGTDVAIETADIILMTEELTKIPYLIKASRQALSAIQQNFFGTVCVDGFGFVLAFIGSINPIIAAFIHISSELVFMINSARLIMDIN